MDPLSGKPHYPIPEGPLPGFKTVNPRRKLAPLLTPTKLVPLPSVLPKSLTLPPTPFTSTHTRTTHIFPAAFPRAQSPYNGRVELSDEELMKIAREKYAGDVKHARKAVLATLAERMIYEKREAESVFPNPAIGIKVGDVGIWGCATRIRRNVAGSAGAGVGAEGDKDRRKAITIVATHAIGFHKETWDPTFKHLIEITERPDSSIRIEEIWSLDSTSHGDAVLLNEGWLPDLVDRSDGGRDIANFVLHFLPEASQSFGQDLGLELPRVSASVTEKRLSTGFHDRWVVPLAHSLGADAAAHCALRYPKLFEMSAIILSESTLQPPRDHGILKVKIVLQALSRRSTWSSRAEARRGLLQTPLFQSFDPAVFEAFMEHALYEDETGKAHLKCHPYREASEFTEGRTMQEGYELLPTLHENVELRWIMGGTEEASFIVGGSKSTQVTMWRRKKNTSNVRLPGGAHFIPQEKPQELAEEVALFLGHKFGNEKGDRGHSRL